MKKFIIQVSHTEYAKIGIEAKNKQEAEELVFENIDCAGWGNDETEIIDIEEINNDNKNKRQKSD
ncbi:MAG: hypothetical protein A3H67_03465 [Candidatus Buchananbacteria bacterium RIFCSPLOWO2_02_FULL_46_11b]|uniref:Uncharacterized protein n=1 Tax=Candidatus Buchananbacteria bacterium RIFCSPLOWO2_02_FULL_46_11b TaxID=1797548 RepID=A0A1G1YZ82_9BACT|nr:MAG: hypothetical protein A3H67_03465 [Candidatus Buchananbacteria bacterium RIFCSPLOWO2_02_FULL_46_11b]